MPSTWPPAMANRNISIAGPRDRGVLLLPKKSAGWLPIKAAAPQTTHECWFGAARMEVAIVPAPL